MNLWEVKPCLGNWAVIDGGVMFALLTSEANAQDIADEHNAWEIMAEYGWEVYLNYQGKWVVTESQNAHEPRSLAGRNYVANTPVQAVLAAYRWIQEHKGAQQA